MRRSVQAVCSLLLVTLLAACGGSGGGGGSTPRPDAAFGLKLETVNAGLNFPLFLTVTPLPGDTRLFVVEKGGKIKIVDRATGNLLGVFLDISSLVSTGSEQGLLGLAFDPLYATNRRFYVSYTDTAGNSVIARYLVSGSANVAVSTADLVMLTVAQPFPNHNGGMITFGSDGFLYIGFGDGGGGGDPDNRAQNMNDLLGKLLRIDVTRDDFPTDTTRNYGVPPSNPFVGQANVKEEIWSFGLRNPWRYSFDRQTGDLYIADVGQGTREEVNVSTGTSAGKRINYGWNITEGSLCFPIGSMCSTAGLTLPLIEYDHSAGACSITGGYVYRGTAVPALQGTYFYGDFCARFVRSFRLSANGSATEEADWPALSPSGNITSFGEDAVGELYIMTHNFTTQQGSLFRIVPN